MRHSLGPTLILNLLVVVVTVTLPAGAADTPDSNWPGFRGPGSAGVFDSADLPATWNAKENVAWSVEVPGLGWSSPVVWGDRVLVTSVIKDGVTERPKMGLYLGQSRGGGTHRFMVYCFDAKTGKRLWDREAKAATPRNIHLKNSFASATPTTDGERLYVWFHQIGLFCLDMDGKPLWSVDTGASRTRNDWGAGASPVLHQDRVYVVNDNEEQSYLACFDKRSGKELWRVPRDKETNWSTPFVWEHALRTEIVVPATKRVISYDLEGKELWSLKGMSSITICTPFTKHGLLYVASGYFADKLKPVYAIRPGAMGDNTLKDGEEGNEFIAWCNRRAAPYNPSPLVYGNYLYVLLDQGFLACYDARTGKEVYSKKRLESGGGFTASPWAYGGKVFCLSESGVTTVVEAGPVFKVVGTNELEESTLATPAMTSAGLFIRTAAKLYCVRSRESPAAERKPK